MPDLTILGQKVVGSISADQLETFPTPEGVDYIEFETRELTAFCPVTSQPDLYRARIGYMPTTACIESKALKLYLHSFRDRGAFAEALASEIAGAIKAATQAEYVNVTLWQQVRGGLALKVEASR